MTSYRIIIDRFTYGRQTGLSGFEEGIEYAIQAYENEIPAKDGYCKVFPASIRSSPDDFNVKLAEVMLKLERRCDPSPVQTPPAKQTPTPRSETPLPPDCCLMGFDADVDTCQACESDWEGK
jgi:hypothetical protein